ncbi:hypothetical protein ES703_39919 [subsurface metagenome]
MQVLVDCGRHGARITAVVDANDDVALLDVVREDREVAFLAHALGGEALDVDDDRRLLR